MSEASYGDVTAEYRALRDAAGLVTPGSELVWVRGPDAVTFLDGLLSQDVAGPESGEVARSFLLQPQGKLEALLWVLRGEDEVALVADPGRGTALLAALERFRFRVDAALDTGVPCVEVWGPGSAGVLEAAGAPVPDGWVGIGEGVVAAVPMGTLPRFLVPAALAPAIEEAGARRCGTVAATTVRIEAGQPLMGVDVDEGTIPQESGLVPEAVSFTKGCYLGQELVARIDSRGRVNRVLRAVVLEEAVIPPEGAAVVAGDREAGVLTSVGESLTLRAPIALAMVHRQAEPGDAVEVRWKGGSAAARVAEVPLDDFAGG